MVYITGDIHGDVKYIREAIEQYSITGNDIIVILGDVGMNYYGKHGDRQRKKKLNRLGVPILCIHGNHEMRPFTIPTYFEASWNGGIVYEEAEFPNLHFAKDGEIYDLEGAKSIVIGGAYSVDKWHRLQLDIAWFPDEQPSAQIKQDVEAALCAANWNVDVVFSHTCPFKYEPIEVYMPAVDQSKVDKSTEQWLDTIEDKLNYKRWYCGHWHVNKHIDKIHFLYHDFDVLSDQQLQEPV